MQVDLKVSLKGSGKDVLWISPNGGNVRCTAPHDVEWENLTGHDLELTFTDLPHAAAAPTAKPVWPFSGTTGPTPNPKAGTVTIPDKNKFKGTLSLAGTGQAIIKYSADVPGYARLDPIIIVER